MIFSIRVVRRDVRRAAPRKNEATLKLNIVGKKKQWIATKNITLPTPSSQPAGLALPMLFYLSKPQRTNAIRKETVGQE